MIEYIGEKQPKINEERLHFQTIKNLMSRYKRIVVIIPFGSTFSGENVVIGKLQQKYAETDWNFYYIATELIEPFIYISNDIETAPVADVYYIIQYSTEYKEATTGIKFKDGFPRPLSEYNNAKTWYELSKLQTKLGRVYKSKTEIRKLVR